MRQRPLRTHAVGQFETTTRIVRWLVVATVLVTFPITAPNLLITYALTALFALYNLLRYYPPFLRNRIFSKPNTVIFLDILFACIFIGSQNNILTPYSSFLVFMIITAAYQYRMKGVYTVAALETAVLLLTSQPHFSWLSHVQLSQMRTIAVFLMTMLVTGWMVERYTRSERHEREQLRSLNQENESERSLLLSLLDSLHTAIFVVDNRGIVTRCNAAASALIGSPVNSVHGKKLKDVMQLRARSDPTAKPVDIMDIKRSAKEPDAQHRRDLVFTNELGATLDLDITIQTVQLEYSNTVEYVVVCDDITHERTLDEQRAEFISVASHELRTPVAILEAALSTLIHGQGTADAAVTATLLKQAHDNVLLLGNLVKDLATLAEARNDNLPIKLDRLSPADLVKSIVNDFSAQAHQKGLKITVNVAPHLPALLSTESYIREILQNYVTNAIKYTKTGTIVLAVAPDENDGVVFSVKDSGLGISAKDQRFLFRKFFRAEDYRVRETGGTGLGLYLCNELAGRLGGRVWCKSVLNEGSTFFLQVPPFSNLRRDRKEVTRSAVANLIEDL